MSDIYEALIKVREQEESKKFQITMVVSVLPGADVDEDTIDNHVKDLVEDARTLVVDNIHAREVFGE